MGNEPSKRSSCRKSADDRASKSNDGSTMGPLEALSSSLCELCSPILKTNETQQADVDFDPSSGKHKTGRSTHHQPSSRAKTRPTTNTATHDKSDRSIKTSIKNVQLDVSGAKGGDKKPAIPTDESAHTFAASLASSSHYRKGNDYVMITDAMSDVRVK